LNGNYLIFIASFDQILKLISQFPHFIIYSQYYLTSMILPFKLFITLHFHNLSFLGFRINLILFINLQPNRILLFLLLPQFFSQNSQYFFQMIQLMITMLLLNIDLNYYFSSLIIHFLFKLRSRHIFSNFNQFILLYYDQKVFLLQYLSMTHFKYFLFFEVHTISPTKIITLQ
jgi:hypothetical protein